MTEPDETQNAADNRCDTTATHPDSPLRILARAYADQQIDRSLYLQLRGNILDHISGDMGNDQKGDLTLPLVDK